MAKRYYESESAEGMSLGGQGNFANMPTEVVFKAYPIPTSPLANDYNDGLSGVDSQLRADEAKRNSAFKSRKA
jgi:hypothetical protein